MPNFLLKIVFIAAVSGTLWEVRAQVEPHYPQGNRVFVAEQICYGPFSEEDYAQCVAYLVSGHFQLDDDVEFQVLSNLVYLANTELDLSLGSYQPVSRLEATLDIFSQVEGRAYPREILEKCTIYHFRYDGKLLARSDEWYLQCILDHSSKQP